MSNNNSNAKKFLEKVWADETLRDRIGGKAPEEIVEAAAELGFEVTAEELKDAAENLQIENAEGNAAAAEKIKELNVDEMDKVAGGYYFHPEVCSSNFDDGEDCWFNDYCDIMWNLYMLKDDNRSARCERTVKSTDWH